MKKSFFERLTSLSKSDLLLLKRSGTYILPHKVRFFTAFFCLAASIAFSLIQPYCFGKIVASVMEKKVDTFLFMLLIMAVAYVFQQGIVLLQSYIFTSLNEKMVYDVKRDMFEQILNLPVSLFDRIRIGEFLSRLNGDAAAISNIITGQLINSVMNLLQVLIIGFTAFNISWKLFLVVIFTIPVTFLIYTLFGKFLRRKNMELAKIRDSYFSTTQETIAGIREVKGLGIIPLKFMEFLNLSGQQRDKGIRLNFFNSLMQSATQFVKFASELVVLFMGFFMVTRGELKLELFIAFTSYAAQFSGALMNLTGLNASLQQAMISIGRIYEVIDGFNQKPEPDGNLKLDNVSGSVRFQNVHFGYSPEMPVFRNISLEIPAGKKIAIVGSSGVGKTTLSNLLLRFYKPAAGNIYIDNIDLNDLAEGSIRRHITVVRQEPFLFRTSITDNMLFTEPQATREDIISVCKAAFIHDDIMRLPQKYDTVIGEGGVNFSGGQRQRLAIARALLKKAKIVVFDEATSALDNESQYKIKQAIDGISGGVTVIIIAHRLFTVVDADIIYVLSRGQVVGKGIHQDLINQNEIYKDLYKIEVDALTSRN